MPDELLSPEIVKLLSAIHEYKGSQSLFMGAKSDILDSMLEIAKIQSTGASNRIEGIYTSDERLESIVKNKSQPRNRSEIEIAGYREVLSTIHENHEFIKPTPNIILQLHRDLYSFSASSQGGTWKNSDNIIAETHADGTSVVRFQPVSAYETPSAVESLCNALDRAIFEEIYDPLLLVPVFILDFLCIHPFNDGNGRMSRLLTLLLLYRSGYIVGKYISLERIIEKTKETYYDVLKESSDKWHENTNSYYPFVKYYLEVILNAYKEFSARVEHLQYKGISKPERIRKLFDERLGKLTKKEILEICPDISMPTVESTLNSLVKEEYILKLGAGRSTAYIRNRG